MEFFSQPSTKTDEIGTVLDCPEASIVIPCLNEVDMLETVIRKASHAIVLHHLHADIIVADNRSTDGSQEIAMRLGAKVVAAAVRGYGATLQAGIEQANGAYLIMEDADDSYDFTEIYPFIQQLRLGFN